MNAEQKARERARELKNRIDAFITRDGEWDTDWQAEDAITAALLDFRKEGWKSGHCESCGELVDDAGDWTASHTRAEHDPKCDGSCSVGCPIAVQCGPVRLEE